VGVRDLEDFLLCDCVEDEHALPLRGGHHHVAIGIELQVEDGPGATRLRGLAVGVVAIEHVHRAVYPPHHEVVVAPVDVEATFAAAQVPLHRVDPPDCRLGFPENLEECVGVGVLACSRFLKHRDAISPWPSFLCLF